jgi:hypothetical protein
MHASSFIRKSNKKKKHEPLEYVPIVVELISNLFIPQESHSDGRILSDSDRNLIGFHHEFNKTMKSYGIPGDGPTVGSYCWNPIGSNVGIHRNPTPLYNPCALLTKNAYSLINKKMLFSVGTDSRSVTRNPIGFCRMVGSYQIR